MGVLSLKIAIRHAVSYSSHVISVNITASVWNYKFINELTGGNELTETKIRSTWNQLQKL